MGTLGERIQFGRSRDLYRGQHHPPVNRIEVLTACEGEQAFALLVIPDLDLVIISTRAEDGLGWVERDTSNGT